MVKPDRRSQATTPFRRALAALLGAAVIALSGCAHKNDTLPAPPVGFIWSVVNIAIP